MILGDVCTRACAYCAVAHGRPAPLDLAEPGRVAEAIARMNLQYAVITSVDRDDQADGGAAIFAETIRLTRQRVPACRVEVLIPDFRGVESSLFTVLDAGPDVLNHNIETVPRLYGKVRPGHSYQCSLNLLQQAKRMRGDMLTKSGFMVGVGETYDEVRATLEDLRVHEVDIITIGQYLQPSTRQLKVERYVTPEEFSEFKTEANKLGFRHVESGPLVRSSYHAWSHVN
jgi:lipoic acid synthetase